MLDYDIIRVFRPIIIDGLTALSADYPALLNTKVVMNYQTTKQGIKHNAVYFHNIGDRNIGTPLVTESYDDVADVFYYTETQKKETTFQINTVLKQDLQDLSITSKDLCTFVNLILSSRRVLGILKLNNVGILRIGEIINTPYMGGDDNYMYNPSFDFTVVHEHTMTSEGEKIDKINGTIQRI